MATAKIAIISGRHPEAYGRLILVVERLRDAGHEVILIADDETIPKGLDLVAVANERIPAAVISYDECKVASDWKRSRDYPTLKQGLRMPRIKRRGR